MAGLALTDIVLGVGVFVLMTGVGASVELQLLRKLFHSRMARKAVCVGAFCQFGVMPLIAYLLTLAFGIEQKFTALGFVLAGCMPGGSASNVLTTWCKGILELSVCMTIVSNILAFGLTPLCLYVYGKAVGVDSVLAFRQIATAFAFLIAPLTAGAALTYFRPHWKKRIEQGLGTFAMIIFVLVIVLVCLEYPEALVQARWNTIIAALVYFPIAAGTSYIIATLCKFPPSVRRTITVETGLQNLSLAFAIGELSVTSDEARLQLMPFPLFYALFMYLWMGMLLPTFRYQHKYNTDNNIDDDGGFRLLFDDVITNNDDSNKNSKEEELDETVIKVSLSSKRDRTQTEDLSSSNVSLSSSDSSSSPSSLSATPTTTTTTTKNFEHTDHTTRTAIESLSSKDSSSRTNELDLEECNHNT